MQSLETLENLNATIHFCDPCRRVQSQTHAVSGEGASDATLMFVGEAPGKSIRQQIGPYAVFPLYHPAAVLRVHARRLPFEAAFQHISAIL
jgi:uracil-DNA glycosylase